MATSQSTVTGKSGGVKQSSAQSKDAAAPPRWRMNIQMVQNVMLLWLDNNIDEDSTGCRNTITQLRRVVHTVNKYMNVDQCIEFLISIENGKACMMISGSLGQYVVPLVHDIPELDSIFILCGDRNFHKQWAKEWYKIKGVFTDIGSICEALKVMVHKCEQNSMPISIMATNIDLSKKKLDQLDPSFMYTQILKEILLSIKFEKQHIDEFIQYCREALADNEGELKNMKKLEREYREQTPIWWYTYPCFLYPMLNRTLRMMDANLIVRMGFFISDLHRHIEQLHQQQFTTRSSNQRFTVYRGQGLSKTNFEQISKTKGGLFSFNNFLSTSKQRDVSLMFVDSAPNNVQTVGVLFVMTIDPSQSNTPFASITGVSNFGDQEDEVLFSMHTVFRIGEITSMGENSRLFEVELTLTSDNDKDLRVLTDHIRAETYPDEEGWYRLGEVLLKMGEFDKAQQIYEILLDQKTNELEKEGIYNQLGQIYDSKGEHEEAITFFEKSLEIQEKTLPPTDPNMAVAYNNIGNVYQSMCDYPQALSSHEKALAIRQQSLPLNHPDLAMSYNIIRMSDYASAFVLPSNNNHFLPTIQAWVTIRKHFRLTKKHLSFNNNHFLPQSTSSFASYSSYNNIGMVYYSMGDYPQALSSHEKALVIQQQSLPLNHPHLAMSYNNISNVYYSMGHYPQALSSYEKALAIRQQSLPPNHPDLAMSYNNIGNVYDSMGNYPQALSFYKRTLAIQQQSLSSNHPGLAISYNNIGMVYYNMGDYPQALSSHEKALTIKQQSLPPNHPGLASSYNNIGVVYGSMGDYPQALSSLEKAFATQQQSLPPNHPGLAFTYNNIGVVYGSIDDYPQALSSHKKALAIRQQSLPPNHPDLASSYNNIAAVYQSMGDYPQALSSHEKALAIQQQSLPPNYPGLAMSYNNIGAVYENMKNYSKARSFYERAVDIAQQSLPSGHPSLQTMRNNLEGVKKKLQRVFCFFSLQNKK